MPETVDQCKKLAINDQGDAFAEQMMDIHGERLEIMTNHNVELFVLSLASPGPQGQRDKGKAEVRHNWEAIFRDVAYRLCLLGPR